MFIGEYKQKMDTKGRVVVPSKFRGDVGNNVIVARGLEDECLYAFSYAGWEKLLAKLDEQPMSDDEITIFNRFFLAGARDLEVDKLGRVTVPSTLRDHTQLEDEVVWIGVGNRMEIWAVDDWQALNDKFDGKDVENSIDKKALKTALKKLGI